MASTMDLLGGPSGLMEIATMAVRDINKRSQDVSIHRQQCMQLAKRCVELIATLREEGDSFEGSKLSAAVDEFEDVLLKIRKKVIEWANLNRMKSFMRQEQIAADIDKFNQTLDTHVIVSTLELNREQRRVNLYRQHDQEEVKEMLRSIVRNIDDLTAAVANRDDVPALMQTIQEELTDEQPGSDEYTALRGGLSTLHNKTGILPPLTNLTGQVTKLSEHPAAEGGTADIYEGQWVGDEKVMLKAIRHVESESAVRRFRREVDIWRRLQHKNILRCYGVCYIGPRLFAVAPWADGGNLQVFIRKNPDCDRTKLLSEVALGLQYLHTFLPTIVHGDLRAANVLVSANGEALLADFGLSRIVAEEEGPVVASTSLSNAGSFRWMAPELFESDANSSSPVSAASDVWSFGMLCLEVLTGLPPYQYCYNDGQVIAKLIHRILPDRPTPLDDMYELGLSDEMWVLMQRCWNWNAAARPEMRTLASEVRGHHLEHMRQFGVAGCWVLTVFPWVEQNNPGTHPSTLFQGSIWNSPSVQGFIPTPPSSSNLSLSPSNLPLHLGAGLTDSPHGASIDLPSPHTPTSPNNYRTPGAIPIPSSRRSGTVTQQPVDGPSSPTDYLGPGGSYGSSNRSSTLQMLRQQRHHRAASLISRESDIARPDPEGEPILRTDDHGNVLMGNLEGLVSRLLEDSIARKMDDEFRECFLTVYRGFARADDLLQILIQQYRSKDHPYTSERDRVKLREKAVTILTDWLAIQAIEPKDRQFLLNIQAFVDETLSTGVLDPGRKKLRDAINAHLRILDRPPNSPFPGNSGQKIKLTELDPSAVAKQLMRMENELFQKILPSDIAAWVKNVEDEQLQNLPRFVENNYKIADWCQSTILFIDSNEIEKRAQMIVLFRKIAEECMKIRAFSSAHAILAGLTTDFINGLNYTWKLVDKRTKDSLKQISLSLTDEKNYREIIDGEPQLPAIPILMIHLRELRRLYKEMQTHVTQGNMELVNFQKFHDVWNSIKQILRYQRPQAVIARDSMPATYLEYTFSQINSGVELQQRFNARSEELRVKEQRDFTNRRLGMEDAGFRPPARRK
ncbi:hypothetical protein BDV93DRAFT_540063 [Ceratobasidium sp. AG-I]|nr:hypothetical protein BDV93DRAFT_540063 [Ceratobasidium sp. AG-I]